MSDITVGDRVIVTGPGDYDLQNRAPGVVVAVEGDTATVVFEHTDAPVWRGLDDEEFRRVVIDALQRRHPEYFDSVPTYRFDVSRLRSTLWPGWQPRWANRGGEGA